MNENFYRKTQKVHPSRKSTGNPAVPKQQEAIC
jgi:hypothetical protein